MDKLFIPLKFTTYVQLKPIELDEEFDVTILQKLRTTYEGLCTRFGYIREGSVEIVKRSLGQLMKPHFNGYVRFNVVVKAEVCNPVKGMIVEAVIKSKNQLGILAESSVDNTTATKYTNSVAADKTPVLDIIVPRRSAGISSDVDIEILGVGDTVNIEIMGARFQLRDTKISIIGRVVEDVDEVAKEKEKKKTKASAEKEQEETDDEAATDDFVDAVDAVDLDDALSDEEKEKDKDNDDDELDAGDEDGSVEEDEDEEDEDDLEDEEIEDDAASVESIHEEDA